MIFTGFQTSRLLSRETYVFYALSVAVILAFLFGGGARSDIQSLILLRPLAALLCALALVSLSRGHIRSNRFLFGMAGAIILLTIIHLIPLPPSWWTLMPGRDVVVAIERAADMQSGWRPISLSPATTWNALMAMLIPLTILLLGVQTDREQRYALVRPILALGGLSAVIAMGQMMQGLGSPLYFYAITNNDSPVGLFANRNHHAAFLSCLLPMLSVFAMPQAQSRWAHKTRLWLALLFGGFLIPLIIVIGSRSGLITAMVGLAGAIWIYRSAAATLPSRAPAKMQLWSWAALALGIIMLGALTVLMSRGLAFSRLLDPSQSAQGRDEFWPVVNDAISTYFPFGSGVGSFVQAFQIHEPHASLIPTYVNHAHNDWLEVAMTAGVPGILLLLIAVAASARVLYAVIRAPQSKGRALPYRRLGIIIIIIMGLASIGDYPLRTPSLAALFVVATLWVALGSTNKTPLPLQAPQ